MKTKRLRKKKSFGDLHWAEQSWDIFLVVGITIGVLFTIAEMFIAVSAELKSMTQMVTVLLLGIFFTDLTRTFLKCKNFKQFFSHHFIDIIFLLVMIFSFSSVMYLGLGRLSWLVREEGFFLTKGKNILNLLKFSKL